MFEHGKTLGEFFEHQIEMQRALQVMQADRNNYRGWKHGNSKRNGRCNPTTPYTFSFVRKADVPNYGIFRCRQNRKLCVLPMKVKK